MMTTRKHDRWIEALVRDGFQTGGFMRALGEILLDEPRLRLIPDAWRLRRGADAAGYDMASYVTIVEVVEVEGSAPLNERRLMKWVDMWQEIDGSDDVELVLYGLCATSGAVRRIDLAMVYLDHLSPIESEDLLVTLPVAFASGRGAS